MQAAILAIIPCYYINVYSLININLFLTYVIIYFYFIKHEINVKRNIYDINIKVIYLT